MIDNHIRAPVVGVVIWMNIAVAHRCSAGASITARLDVAQVVTDEQHAGRVEVQGLAGKNQGFGVRLAVLDVIRANQQCRTFGQAQLLHDRLGETHRLVGDHAPQQVAFLDIGQQLGHAVVELAVYRAALLIALKELQAQGFELRRLGVEVERDRNHRLGTARHHVADALVVDGRQATLGEHRLADGNEVRRRVEQGAVHVEKYCSQAHAHSSRRVWIM
ncbi:hypothetical protein D3C79_769640 [compost metagenome]